MSFKSILRDLKEVRDGLGGISKRGWSKSSHIAPDHTVTPSENIPQSPWASLPPELLHEIIRRVEESEASWPARAAVVSCASVCKSWRGITMETVRVPEQCGKLTFPISLKQVKDSFQNFFIIIMFKGRAQSVCLICEHSRVRETFLFNALLKGTEQQLHIFSTMA